MTPSASRGVITHGLYQRPAAAPPVVLRCMEEMGDWAKVLEVIDSENVETAAAGGGGAAADEAGHERLFLREDGWDGPKFLRCGRGKDPPGVPMPRMHGAQGAVAMLLALF